MTLTFPNLDELLRHLARLDATLADPALPLELANRQRERLLQRTAAGLDLTLHAFRPYALAYRRTRLRQGLTSSPNLRRTGAMLDSLVARATATGAELTFATPYQATKAAANHALRPFFGISPAEAEAMLRDLADRLANP
jgi:hypothetical protein